MGKDEYLDTLKAFGTHRASDYRETAFSRNIGLFSPGEQERLAQAKVAINQGGLDRLLEVLR